MLQVILIMALIGIAIDTTRTVRRNRALFAEFKQTTAVQWLVWLYPLPLVIPIFDPSLVTYLVFPLPLGILLFLPAITVATVNRRHFERAGTDRADRAQQAADRVIMSGVLAVICFLAVAVVSWILPLLN
jgi:hypothetical protein